MENTIKKKKKLLLLIPVFLVPIILLFSMLLSKKNSGTPADNQTNQNVFNDKLPAANLKETGKNKLEIYMQAQKDSAKLKEQQDEDPYSKKWFDPTPPPDAVIANDQPNSLNNNQQLKRGKEDINEKKVNERLDKLMAALNSNNDRSTVNSNYPSLENHLSKNDFEIEKLEKMLAAIQAADTTGNPEMKQLEIMLDKILDIQHPERAKDRFTNQNNQNKKDTLRYTVSNNKTESNSDLFTAPTVEYQNAFWGLTSSVTASNTDNQSFMAVIHENQKIQEGQSIKLRLLQDVFIDNKRIPKGQFIFGKCQLSEGRVNVSIRDISYNNMVFPVQLIVYDQADGMQGINIQGDMTEEVSKNGMDQLIQQMQLNAMTTSIGVQAATSGIQTAKNLLSKKIKKVTVPLKSGHVLLLKPVQS